MRSQTSQSHLGSKKDQQNSLQSKHINNPLEFFTDRGGFVIENECGWLNYYIEGEVAYLENMHIYRQFRNQQKGTSLLSTLEMKLVEIHKCKALITTINRVINSKETDRILAMTLKRGFKFFSSDESKITLTKEL